MKKSILISALMLMIAINGFAQLKVSNDGTVTMAEETELDSMALTFPRSKRLVLVGEGKYNAWYQENIVGLSSTLKHTSSVYNVGVLGEGYRTSQTPQGKYYAGVVGMTNGGGLNASIGTAGVVWNSATEGIGIYGSTQQTFTSIQGKYAGYFRGPVYMTSTLTAQEVVTTSDERLKENIQSMGSTSSSSHETLDKVLDMNVVQYNYKPIKLEAENDLLAEDGEMTEIEAEALEETDERLHFGVLAQELQTIYPNLVKEGQDGYLAVNYIELVPVLIKAIQEQQEEFDALKGSGTVRKAKGMTGIGSTETETQNKLYQNNPNPFKEQTVIRFALANEASDAAVCIFDMTGKQLKRIPVTTGMDSVTVNGSELGAGMFLYSLIVDGREIDTKRMILSK